MDELKFAIGELLTAAYRETGEAKFPASPQPVRSRTCGTLSQPPHPTL